MLSDITPRVGYVLKVYPRFSETFVVTEILAREAHGEDITVFALRPTTDARFHSELARVQAPVHHIPRPSKPLTLWTALRTASADTVIAAGIACHLDQLLAADVDDAVQAVLVAQAARAAHITHLHAHFATAATSVARLASLVSGIPYSFTAHAKDLFHESASHDDLEAKFRDAAFAVTVSDYNLAFLRERLADTTRVHRVYNGLELARFPFAPQAAHDGTLRLLTVGRLVEKKGFDLLIDAVARLRRGGAAVTLDIVGDGELRADLDDRIARTGEADAIRLLGPLPQADVVERLRRADAFVAPCRVAEDGNADGLPTVLLEAMASGVLCISTAVTGIPEVIRHRETGLLCPPDDIDALAALIADVAEPGFDASQMVRRARSLVERDFDSVAQAARLGELTRTSVTSTRRAA